MVEWFLLNAIEIGWDIFGYLYLFPENIFRSGCKTSLYLMIVRGMPESEIVYDDARNAGFSSGDGG